MARTIKSVLASGEAFRRGSRLPNDSGRHYESFGRRAQRLMCADCVQGKHHACEFEDCPCCCNDSDFRFARNKLTAIGTIPPGAISDQALWQLLHRA